MEWSSSKCLEEVNSHVSGTVKNLRFSSNPTIISFEWGTRLGRQYKILARANVISTGEDLRRWNSTTGKVFEHTHPQGLSTVPNVFFLQSGSGFWRFAERAWAPSIGNGKGLFSPRRIERLPRVSSDGWSFIGTLNIIGSPVIWHRQSFGSDTKICVSVRRWSIASSPMLVIQIMGYSFTGEHAGGAYRWSRVSHSGPWSAVTMVLTNTLEMPIRAMPCFPRSPSLHAYDTPVSTASSRDSLTACPSIAHREHTFGLFWPE